MSTIQNPLPQLHQQSPKSVDEIIESLCRMFNVKRFDIMSNKRHYHLVDARYAIFHVLHFHPLYRMNLSQLSRLFRKDHTTILYNFYAYERIPAKRDRMEYRLHEAHLLIFGHTEYIQPYSPKKMYQGAKINLVNT